MVKLIQKNVEVVSPGYLKELKFNISNDKVDKLLSEGKTIVFLIIDGEVIGAIALADIIRDESKETIKYIQRYGNPVYDDYRR